MKSLIRFIFIGLALLAGVNVAWTQGTAFTYQGQLLNSGSPANGSYDMSFTLFATNAGGVAVAAPVTNRAVAVSNGLFITAADLGNVYTAGSNWLQIAVSTNGANAFYTLSPRQQLTPVPYSVTSANSAMLANGTALGAGTGNSIAASSATDSFIGGGQVNGIGTGADHSAIAGGYGNEIGTNSYESVIAGGEQNDILANAGWSVIGGGQNNQTLSGWSFIGGGNGNYVGRATVGSSIGGGFGNTNAGSYATIGGGYENNTAGIDSTIPGGVYNVATGAYSFAAGFQAQAVNQGAFVWADSQAGPFASKANDSFNVRAQGGAQFVTSGAGMSVDGAVSATGITNAGTLNVQAGTNINLTANNNLSQKAGSDLSQEANTMELKANQTM